MKYQTNRTRSALQITQIDESFIQYKMISSFYHNNYSLFIIMGNQACRHCQEANPLYEQNVTLANNNKIKLTSPIKQKADYKIQKLGENRTRIVYSTGQIYEGQTQGYVKHGQGKLQWPSGNFYQGQWLHDKTSGQGIFSFNGAMYRGTFKDNQFIFGTYTSSDEQQRYQGKFYNQLYHGYGKLHKQNSYKYQGSFMNGLKHGTGTIVFQNGNTYHGQFFNGKFDGKGVFKSSNHQYQGSFKQGEYHGFGKYVWKSGSYYEGNYINGQKHGYGIFVNSQGLKYQGPWKDGKRHGTGIQTNKDGIKSQVTFQKGVRTQDFL